MNRRDLTLEKLGFQNGITDILTACLPHPQMNEFMLLPSFQAVCLAGEAGVGKRTMAAACAGSLEQGFGFARLHVRSFDLPADQGETLHGALESLFVKALEKPSVLLMEMNGCEPLWRETAAFLEAVDPASSLFVVLVEDDITRIRPEWTASLLLCRVLPPDKAARQAFFADAANVLPRRKDSRGNRAPSHDWLASETDGLTYTQLNQVIRRIRLSMKLTAIRGYGGNLDRIIAEGLNTNRFYYTEQMFRDAVREIRETSGAQNPEPQTTVIPPGLFVQSLPAADPLHLSASSVLPAQDGKTEDEMAQESVLSRLKIPPNPNG